jgi:hypothetical protein
MNMDDYPNFFLTKDWRLCSTGQHYLGFPRVIYDTLIRLGYGGEVPHYRCLLSIVDGLDVCETSVMIHLNPVEPWTGTIVGNEPDTTIEQTTHVALTSLCESRLTATAAMPNTLFPIRNHANSVWKKHLEAVSDHEGPHFHAGMAAMTEYVQYFYNLQHNLARTVIQQRLGMASYYEHNTSISHELGQLKHEDALLHSGTLPPLDQDCKWKVVYHCLSEAKHGWNYTRQQRDTAHDLVDERTHVIIHLKHANE